MKETKTLEFKSEITNTFLKTVSAFANYGAGSIEFGIRDDGSVCGIENPEQACLDLENRINDSISPKPDYTLSVNNRTRVITLRVSEGAYKPYCYKGKAYRRSDSSTVEVDRLELNRLTLEGSNQYYEGLPAHGETFEFHFFEKKLQEKLGIKTLSDDILRTFGFFTRDRKYNLAAALFADRNEFPGIDIARFGKNISEIRERKTASGVCILQQYDEAVEMYRRYYQYEKIEGIERMRCEMIPEVAFREAVANALIHRTWDVRAHIIVSMFEDHIEISSPGGLPKGISEEEYINGMISQLRNPIIGNVFFRLHYVEMFGTGIRRIREAYRSSTNRPEFRVYENSVQIILPVISQTENVTLDGKTVLDLLSNGILLSSSEISSALGWKKEKVIRVLNQLKESGSIDVRGKARGTKYGLRK